MTIDITTVTREALKEMFVLVREAEGDSSPVPWDADIQITEDNKVRISGHVGPNGMGSCTVECTREEAALCYVFEEE